MNFDDAIVVSCSVVTDNAEHAARAVEAFARAATGLAFEGMQVSVSISKGDHEEVE